MINVSLKTKCPIRIKKWKLKEGMPIAARQLIMLYEETDSAGDAKNSVLKYKSNNVGTVKKICAAEGSLIKPGEIILQLEECTHPTVMKDMCAECGADLRQSETVKVRASVPMVHSIPELKVSEELAQTLGKADEARLLKDKKLVLLVDLDQTLIHTTNDNIPPNLKDVVHFQLHGPKSQWYHTRIRPGTEKFLESVSNLYELHICTFGARDYAHYIAMFLDPDGRLFSHRILSRDECFDANSKTANLRALFPCGDTMVCIIDDREDVWNYAPNLIHVKPYHFFQHTGDINAPPGLTKKENDTMEEGFDFSKLGKKTAEDSEKDKKSGTPLGNKKKSERSGETTTDKDTEDEKDLKPNKISSPRKSEANEAEKKSQGDEKYVNSSKLQSSLKSEGIEGEKKVPKEENQNIFSSSEILEANQIKKEILEDEKCMNPNINSSSLKSQANEVEKMIQESQKDIKPNTISSSDILEANQIKKKIQEDEKCMNPNINSSSLKSQANEVEKMIQESQKDINPNTISSSDILEANQIKKEIQEDENNVNPNKISCSVKSEGNADEINVQEDKNISKPIIINRSESEAKCNDKQIQENLVMKGATEHQKVDAIICKSEKDVVEQFSVLADETLSKGSNIEILHLKTDPCDLKVEKPVIAASDKNGEEMIEVEDPDDYLLHLEDILKKVHATYYEIFDKLEDKNGPLPDLKVVIPEVKRKVLDGCKLVFSGLVPSHVPLDTSRVYAVAESLGATVTTEVSADTTHLVAARAGTVKVNSSRRQKGVHIVTPHWLWHCAERWEKVDERLYPLARGVVTNRHPPAHCGSPQHPGELEERTPRPRTDSGRFSDTINPLLTFSREEMARMDQEVEDLCADDDDSESEEEKEIRSPVLPLVDPDSSSCDSLTGASPKGWEGGSLTAKKRKIETTTCTESDLEEDSPSAKFRRGEPLPSDLDLGEDSQDDTQDSQDIDGDDSTWTLMGAALEREFLSGD